MGEQQQVIFPSFLCPSFTPLKPAFENFGFPFTVKRSVVLLLCLLSTAYTTLRVSVAHTMFRVRRGISKKVCSMGRLSWVAWNVGENRPVRGEILCFSGLEVYPWTTTGSQSSNRVFSRRTVWHLQRRANHCSVLGTGYSLPDIVQ